MGVRQLIQAGPRAASFFTGQYRDLQNYTRKEPITQSFCATPHQFTGAIVSLTEGNLLAILVSSPLPYSHYCDTRLSDEPSRVGARGATRQPLGDQQAARRRRLCRRRGFFPSDGSRRCRDRAPLEGAADRGHGTPHESTRWTVVDLAGDGMLVEFTSAVNAVRWAAMSSAPGTLRRRRTIHSRCICASASMSKM